MANSYIPTVFRRKLGFTKTSNLVYFLISAGGLFLFCLARSPYLSFSHLCDGTDPPGGAECFIYFSEPLKKFGIRTHLWSVIPAGLLAVPQFVPYLRQRYPAYHRTAGYISSWLMVPGIPTGTLILNTAFGGDLSTRSGGGALSLYTAYALFKGVTAARERDFAAHRRWMIRLWAWAGCIVTVRPLMVLIAIATSLPSFARPVFSAMPCDQLAYLVGNQYGGQGSNASIAALRELYPVCAPDVAGSALNPTARAVVRADLFGAGKDEGGIYAALNANFGTSIWIALALHATLTEIYFHMTPSEDERLDKFSESKKKAFAKAEAKKEA